MQHLPHPLKTEKEHPGDNQDPPVLKADVHSLLVLYVNADDSRPLDLVEDAFTGNDFNSLYHRNLICIAISSMRFGKIRG